MKIISTSLIGYISLLLLGTLPPPKQLDLPKNFPAPSYSFEKNSYSSSKFELGRALFYDPVLSLDSTVSCASCHLQYTAFTHIDHALSHGIKDRIGKRNAPALMNLAWGTSFMWDGAVNHLDVQALAPIHDSTEMAFNLSGILTRINNKPIYKKLFFDAYEDSVITMEGGLKALGLFQASLISADSKYDKVMRSEANAQFTAQESRGYTLFNTHCNSCHTAPLFTNNSFQNNGLKIDSVLQDKGRMTITQQAKDLYKFKVPTLRNIEFSKPYMHDGRFKTLYEVLEHYTAIKHQTTTLATQLKYPLKLTPNEKTDLMAFLLTLTDQKFLFNPNYGFPRHILLNN